MTFPFRLVLIMVSLFMLSQVSCMAQEEKRQMLNGLSQHNESLEKPGIVVLVEEDVFFVKINEKKISQKNVAVLLIPSGLYQFGLACHGEKKELKQSNRMNIGAGRYYYIERTLTGEVHSEDISFLRNVKNIKKARKAFRIIGDCYFDQKNIKKAVAFYHVALKLGDEDLEPIIRKMEKTLKR